MKLCAVINNEKGSVMIISIVMLLNLTIVGMCTVGSSTIEVKIAGQKRFYDVAFSVALSGLDYVRATHPFGTIDWTNDTWNFNNPGTTDLPPALERG